MAKKKTAAKKKPTDPSPLVITEEASRAIAGEMTVDANLRVMADNEWQELQAHVKLQEALLVDLNEQQKADRGQLDDMLDRLSRAEKTLLEIAEQIGPLAIIVDRHDDRLAHVEKRLDILADNGVDIEKAIKDVQAALDKHPPSE